MKRRTKCPYCRRPARECWTMACLDLDRLRHRGPYATNAWLKRCKAPFYVERKL